MNKKQSTESSFVHNVYYDFLNKNSKRCKDIYRKVRKNIAIYLLDILHFIENLFNIYKRKMHEIPRTEYEGRIKFDILYY